MMILKVNQRFASANQENTSEKTLYCAEEVSESQASKSAGTHDSLNVEEEHANEAVTRPVQLEEIDESVLFIQ